MSTSFEDKLAAVPAHLRELVRRRLAGEQPHPEDREIAQVPRDGVLPMSFAQQRLWFHAELEPGSAEYNALRALRLRGDLDIRALTAALNHVVRRHESLRSTFDAVDGRGFQVVHDHVDLPLPLVDLSGRASDGAVEQCLLDEMNTPYDLRRGPLFRPSLLRMGARDHVLVLSMHHIVSDGWSMGRLAGELSTAYTAELSGTEAVLPPLPVQYADYAAWQRNRAAGPALDDQLAYWRGRLDRMTALELPTDRPRPPVRTSAGAVHVFEVPEPLVSRLRGLSRDNGATLFMPLAAATKLLLSRYSGEQDIALGTVTSGRGRPDLENLIGFFINTVVLRSQVDGSLPFTAFLSQVRSTLLDAFANEEVPFQRLVEILRPERDPSRPPLVQVMVNLQNTADGAPAFHGLEVSEIQPPMNVAKLDLTFDFYEDARSLTCYLEYSTDLYDRATIERMSRHLLMLLTSITEAPDSPLHALAMLTEAELHELTTAWQGPTVRRGPARCVHELFDEQARRSPDAIAVSCGDERLTFAGLAARADQLAQHLTGLGVGPGVLVGVCLERGVDAVVALLGVLKAGGAFLPLDPDHPAQRLTTMLDDGAASVVITEARLRDRVAAHQATIVDMDRDRPALDRLPAVPPATTVTPDDLAYVVYTSGSTGTPKGVMVNHHNVRHIMRAWDARYGLTRLRGRCLSVSSLGVDVFFGDFLLSTLFGGELVVCPADVVADPPALAAMLGQEAPEILVTTPSLAKAVSQELTWVGGSLDSLRVLAVGSEPWLADDCAKLLEQVGPDTVVTNAYGATETTVDSTVFELRADPIGPAAMVPVGRPLINTRVYVLDARMSPVPVGVFGELYIGGDGVAQGYWNRPDLTERRFLRDPFTTDPEARLYRTGDLGRWRADGNLELVGRADDQVKVRGFRVELGEVETAIMRHTGIAAAAAAVRRDETGRDRLVGYVVPAGDRAPDLGELRAFLADIVPDPAVPSALVILDALPLTSSGTLDRRALPAPDRVERAADRYVPPRTHVETVLTAVWAEVLGVDQGGVGIEDNFFGLGGDSILGLQVVSRARRAGLRLTAKQIFLHQTVADLATVVTVEDVPRAAAGPAVGDVRLTPVQHWFFEEYPDGAEHFNQSMFLELSDDPDVAALRTAFAGSLAHHDALRLRAERTADGWRQHYASIENGEVFRTADLSELDEPGQDRAMRDAVMEAQRGLRLDTGPLVRAVFFTLGRGRSPRLFVTAHHLVVDGVSWRVLLSDLDTVYQQAARGEDVRLEPKTSSYRDWSGRLGEAVAAGRFERELAYWSEVERAVENAAVLPVDGSGENTVGSARTVSVRLSAETTRALLRDVPGVYRTQVNDVLLGALATVLSAWTGGDTIPVEMEGHGREDLFDDVDLSRTVGWFTTLFPVALTVPSAPDWGAVIKAVKEQLREIPTAGLGYGALRYLGNGGALGRGRPCQVGFNYHGRFDVDTDDGGLVRGWLPSPVADRSPDLARQNLIEVTGMVRQGELEFGWEYAVGIHHEATIARLAAEFVAALEQIVEHCARPGAGGCTPSDFPLAGLDQDGVDRIAGDGRSVEDVYPLTPMQSGLLFHSLGAHDTDIYFTHFGLVLDGVTDPEILAEAFQRVVDRTPILRTAVAGEEAGEPLQVVYRDVRLPVTQHDWRGLSAAAQEERKKRLWEEATRQELDLTRPPLMRLHMARLSETGVQILWSSHHILLDGWSFADVLSEVFEEHAALTGEQVSAPKVRRPYREYVRWLADQDKTAAADHWRRTMAGFTAPTPLPFDRAPVRAHQSRDSAWLDLALSQEHTRRLERFARNARLTVNTVIQGAWAMSLSRYSGERDVSFGTTVSGRPAELPGADEMIGLFINTLPARVRVDRDLDTLSWLRRIQEQQVDARQYEYVSLAQVRQWSEIPHGSNLFDSVVVFENFPYDDEAAARNGLQVREMTSVETSNYPLTCVAFITDTLRMRLGYDPRLFDEDTARRFSDHLLGLLDAMVTAPDRPLRALPVAGDAELRGLVVERNDTATGYPARCLPEIFAEQARRVPDAPAVVCGEARLTYAELDARANQLARELAECGVGPEVPVGICLEGGLDMVTAVLGVLKAGGAYVPLDPGYPPERLAYMLDDTAVPVLLTATRLADRLPATRANVIYLDERLAAIARHPRTAPAVRLEPDNLAVLVYTSGSTGVPKGAMLTHRGLVRLVLAAGPHTFGGAEIIAQHHSISFDASQNELWNALLTGACLAVRPGGFHAVDELDEFLKANQVAAMSFSAGFFHAIADTDPGILSGLRKVVIGGEALSPAHCARVLDRLPDLEIVNAYGPTECSVTAGCFPVRSIGPGDTVVPIGRPVAHATIYLLDDDLNVVPTGVAGEAYIGGDGVTRGFWARPAMTVERFVADPFGPPGSRMYRTGDLMRWRADGNLEFVGRTDDQVKVRGFRIELGEIEKVIARHAGVAQIAVIVREDQPGHRRLVAYVVAKAGATVEPKELGRFVAGKIPEYMVPAAFVVLEQLPLTPHGKVDRRALPAPEQGLADRPYVAPRTPVEEAMAGIWSEILGVPRVGVEDNFFELGGDSILSIQVVFRSRRAGLPVSSSDLFRHQTIAELATVAGQAEQIAATQTAVVGAVPLTPIQREFFDTHTVAPHHLTQSMLVELAADVDEDALRTALSAVLAHHDALRLRYVRDGDRWSQYNAPAEQAELLHRHDLSAVAESRRARAMDELAVEADSTLDLAEGPLLRALLFDLGAGRRAWMYLTVHHLVIDAVSWRILNDDLDTAYRQAASGEPVDLGPKTSSFQQWADRLAGHVKDGGFDEQLGYWAALPESTPLPADGPGPNTVSSRRILPITLTERESEALLHVAPGVFRARVNDVLLSALAWTLCRWSGERRLVIELEGHGREEIFDDIDLSRTVGWFTSSYPVVLDVPSLTDQDWPAVVRSVRRCLRSVPGNGLGYGALRHLGPADSALAGRGSPQALFNYHSQIDEITRTDGRSLYHAFHDTIGQEQHPDEQVVHPLEIVGAAEEGRLMFNWHYSTGLHDRATVERVAEDFRTALRSLARFSDPGIER
ncbi:amino acid adenylation domain-containing protein [Nonomuraea sp. NPDC049141]|uniref:amino acid adenylation domain-containing protein n=1 Tax=Nonomuraea sp. NPDC049141 TaxID=3155500 RepID=UPI0033E236F9